MSSTTGGRKPLTPAAASRERTRNAKENLMEARRELQEALDQQAAVKTARTANQEAWNNGGPERRRKRRENADIALQVAKENVAELEEQLAAARKAVSDAEEQLAAARKVVSDAEEEVRLAENAKPSASEQKQRTAKLIARGRQQMHAVSAEEAVHTAKKAKHLH